MIEETVKIYASIMTVWWLFLDLSCWHDWNTVLTVMSSGEKERITEGRSFTCLIRPLGFFVRLEPLAEEVLPCKSIILSGQKFGIRARHEFLFDGNEVETTITSRETFAGILPAIPGWVFLQGRIKKLTVHMLLDLKYAAESWPWQQKADLR